MSTARDGHPARCHLRSGHSPPELPFREQRPYVIPLFWKVVKLLTANHGEGSGFRGPVQEAGVQESEAAENTCSTPATWFTWATRGSLRQASRPFPGHHVASPQRVTFSSTAIGKPPARSTVLTQPSLFIVGEKIYDFSF